MKFSCKNLFFLSFLLIFCDQISKFVAGKMNWVVINKGISFGFFGEKMQLFFGSRFEVLLIGSVIIFLLSLIFKSQKYKLAQALFISGVISNLIDRLIWGGVRDWLIVPVFGLKNNLADWLIFIGLVIILAQIFRKKNYE